MERLAVYQQKSAAYDEAEAPVKAFIGAGYKGVQTPWDTAFEQIFALKDMVCGGMSFGILQTARISHQKGMRLSRMGTVSKIFMPPVLRKHLHLSRTALIPKF